MRFIGIDYFGENDNFILNKDLKTYNITKKDFTSLNHEIRKMLKDDPEKKHFGISFVAGHGMIFEGMQWILLNQIGKDFYRM